MKNITLSAKADHIEKAREKAQRQKTSLNEKFRTWLQDYVSEEESFSYSILMDQLEEYRTLSGKPMSREERNER